MHMSGDIAQQKRFLLNAAEGMTVDAVLDLVHATATDGRQTISHSMMRLFSKLSKYAEAGVDPVRRVNAESTVREHMQQIISDWKLEDPNPTAYGKVLQAISDRKGIDSTNEYIACEPERIVQMGFELAASGPRFEIALATMLQAGHHEALLDLLDNAPDKEFAESAWLFLDSHDILWASLDAARIDFAVLERLVLRKRLSAAEPILDVAERTKDQRTRERLLEVLATLGEDVGPLVARRIEGSRAEFRRDLFLLLGKLSRIPDDFDVSRFLQHTDAVVRREGIRLMLKFLETREQAIVAAVSDSDERAVFHGLQAAQEGGCPPRAVAVIHKRIAAGDLDDSLMTLAIRVVAAADSGAAPSLSGSGTGRTSVMLKSADIQPGAVAEAGKKTMEWLVNKVAQKSRFLRRWQLLPKSPEMLAALGALASYWNQHPDVQEIIQLAIKSRDPELKKAMGAQRVTAKFKAIVD
jgi:hypothetical protein